MKYKNPIIHLDFSDPDVIRVNDEFYLIASSFNQVPGIPILHSKNLVEWEYLGYALNKLPSKFGEVKHGEGVWAPSIRYHNNLFYIVFPMPDEGIFEIHSKNILGPWSAPNLLIEGKGYEDPCPIWINEKAYLVFSFVKSRIGFNSLLALIEVSPDLSKTIGQYQIIYDGHNNNPTIEGPKFYKRNDYFYILAPAGSVKSGWQVALRSKNIFGPYESKIILYQGDTLINGPHQGALIDLNIDDEYVFIHFQDKRSYGRILHLEPVRWINDWPIIGNINDELLPGTPVSNGECQINLKTNYKIQISDDFKGEKLSFMWQKPTNIDDFYYFNKGLFFKLKNTLFNNEINLLPYMFLTKIAGLNFDIETEINLENIHNYNHFGFIVFGITYKCIEFCKENNKIYCRLIAGELGKKDKTIKETKLDSKIIKINGKFRNKKIYDLVYSLKINDKMFIKNSYAKEGKWIGTKLGFYGYSLKEVGEVKINYYHTKISQKNG